MLKKTITLLGVWLACILGCSLPGKEWKTVDGYSVIGEFTGSEDGYIAIKTNSGEVVEIKRARLTGEDLKFLVLLEKYRAEIGLGSWPRRVKTGSQVTIKGGPRTYRTEHFQIAAGSADRTIIIRLATIMEDTLEAISTIPTGLELRPPAPATYFQVRMMARSVFDEEFAKVGMHLVIPSQQVKGAYIASKRELWLPLGGIEDSTIEDLAPTMVHEVCHQTMHDWLPLLPVWFLEGFAEYVAAIPYQLRTFRFDQSEAGLKHLVMAKYQTSPDSVKILHPARVLTLSDPWQNTTLEYLSSLMLVYYLIHLDGSGNGESFNRFVGEIAKSRDEADTMFDDIQKIADTYNSKMDTYKQQIREYNQKLASARSEMRSGKRVYLHSKSNGRLIIGGSPPLPDRPQQPEAPPLKKISAERERTIQFISVIYQRALFALIGNRTIDEFATQMEEAFARKGIRVKFL